MKIFTSLLGHPVQKFFCFNQKIFLKNLVEIIFRYKKNISSGTPLQKMTIFTYEVSGIKKGCVEFISKRFFFENIQKCKFSQDFLDTQYKIFFCSNQKNLFTKP